tara:strand:+ start:84 stop:485 length:402 start_codon:yes stop_codon:yes gene_type:complete
MNLNEKIKIEDALINSFIEDDVPIFDPQTKLGGEAAYESLHPDQQEEMDINALTFFRKAMKAEEKRNKAYSGLTFENFVKIYDPTDDYLNQMRIGTVSSTDPAMVWENIYNRDLNLMKQSAFKGLRTIAAKGS